MGAIDLVVGFLLGIFAKPLIGYAKMMNDKLNERIAKKKAEKAKKEKK